MVNFKLIPNEPSSGEECILPCQITTACQYEKKSTSNNRYCSCNSLTSAPSKSEIL